MKSKFKIKATCKDDTIIVETTGTVTDILTGLRCITKSLITKPGIPSELIIKTVSDAIVDTIMEVEHEPAELDR